MFQFCKNIIVNGVEVVILLFVDKIVFNLNSSGDIV